MGAFHFLPPRKFDPWAGIGFGYEIVNTSAIDARYDDRGERLREPTVVDGSVRGIELLNLQLGADYRATETFRVGPFVSLSVGRYSVSSSDVVFVTSQQVLAGEVDRKPAQHEWLTFGIRGAYNL